jgi:hypothetical protein
MVIAIAAALLLNVTPAVHALPNAAGAAAHAASASNSLPEQPQPAVSATDSKSSNDGASFTLTADAMRPAQSSQSLSTIRVPATPEAKPAPVIGVEVIPSRRKWLILSIAQHSAAAFDAYSTRRALANGATERDPFMEPFAGSPALYGAIQAGPLGLDFVARKMQHSETPLLRHTWWLPQTMSTGLFMLAGAHNLHVANQP